MAVQYLMITINTISTGLRGLENNSHTRVAWSLRSRSDPVWRVEGDTHKRDVSRCRSACFGGILIFVSSSLAAGGILEAVLRSSMLFGQAACFAQSRARSTVEGIPILPLWIKSKMDRCSSIYTHDNVVR